MAAPMTPAASQLDPELRAAFAKAAEINASLGPAEPGIAGIRRNAERARAYWNEGGPELAETSERTVPGLKREVPVVFYRPRAATGPLPVFVYLHGGGFKIGSPRSNDRQMRELAHAWGGIVLSADYLHVPEHVFPSAVEETAAVLQWLHEQGAQWGVDGERIAFGGSSAGAAVAFGAAVHLGGVPWLRAAVGIVAAFSGNTGTASMQQFGEAGVFPDRASVPSTFNDYLPDAPMREDARANVLRADAKLFPPSFLAAAEMDVYRDASAAMAERLRAAGKLHQYKVYPGMSHLFFGFSRSVARSAECVRDVAGFLGEKVPV
jgi:acetyl esterase